MPAVESQPQLSRMKRNGIRDDIKFKLYELPTEFIHDKNVKLASVLSHQQHRGRTSYEYIHTS